MQHKHMGFVLAVFLATAQALLIGRPALAATPPPEITPGLYMSTAALANDTSGVLAGVVLGGRGEAGLITINPDSREKLEEVGAWTDNGDGTLTVTLSGTRDEIYAEPVEIAFAVDGETLTSDAEIFGAEAVEFRLFQSEEEMTSAESGAAVSGISGTYATATKTTSDGTQLVATLYLAEDGTAQGASTSLGDLSPTEKQVGQWAVNDKAIVTVTMTGTVMDGPDGPMVKGFDKPMASDFKIGDNGELISITPPAGIALYPLEHVAAESPAAENRAYISGSRPYSGTEDSILVLVLTGNGGVAFGAVYPDHTESPLELGTWEPTAEGAIAVTIVTKGGEVAAEPVKFTFAPDGDQLIALEWDKELVGADPLVMTLHQGPSTASDTPADAAPALVLQTAVLAGDNAPDVQYTFLLYDDNTVKFVTDLQDATAPVVQSGKWAITDEATLTLTIQDETAGAEPIEIKIERQPESTALAVNPDLFGKDGVELKEVK